MNYLQAMFIFLLDGAVPLREDSSGSTLATSLLPCIPDIIRPVWEMVTHSGCPCHDYKFINSARHVPNIHSAEIF